MSITAMFNVFRYTYFDTFCSIANWYYFSLLNINCVFMLLFLFTYLMLTCVMIQKRFEGTRVTIETFLAWKAKFDSELAEVRRQKGKDDSSNKKMTGTYCYCRYYF